MDSSDVESNYPLAKFLFGKIIHRWPHLDKQEAFAECMLAYVEAMERYDPEKGNLSGYLKSVMRFRLVEMSRNSKLIRIPDTARKVGRKLMREGVRPETDRDRAALHSMHYSYVSMEDLTGKEAENDLAVEPFAEREDQE